MSASYVTIDDVPYFSHNKTMQVKNYALAKFVQKQSFRDNGDKQEFQRRLQLLVSVIDNVEHQARVGDFISELKVFSSIKKEGKAPHWIPESKKKDISSPDLYYEISGKKVAVEVKTLGLDIIEGTVLRSGKTHSGTIDTNYFQGVTKKLDYFFNDTVKKMKCFNPDGSVNGELFLVFFPSQHIRFRDGEDGNPKMHDRIVNYADSRLPQEVKLIVINALDEAWL